MEKHILNKSRKIFGWVFVVSFVILIISAVLIVVSMGEHIGGRETWPAPPEPEGTASNVLTVYISIASLATSTVSLIGFISTTLLQWIKEKRERKLSDLELRRKELEIKKLESELKKNKGKNSLQ
jgi:hypothetical protein